MADKETEQRMLEQGGPRAAGPPDELALQREGNLPAAVLDTISSLILVVDRAGRIVRFNRACEQLAGYTLDEVRGQCFWDLFLLPEDVALAKKLFTALVVEKSPKEYESNWLTRDGSCRLIVWSGTVLLDPAGEVEYIVGTGSDVTARRQMEEKLRESEERYRTLAESAQDFIFIINRDGRIEYLNPAAADQFGRPLHELIGKSPEEIFPKGTFERQGRNLRTVFETGKPFSMEARTTFPGREIWQDTWLVPIKGPQGEVRAVMGVARDVTARKQVEDALRTSEFQYRTTIDAMRDPIHVVDTDLRFVLTNTALCARNEELGLETDVIGRSVFEVFPFLPEQVRQEYEHVFATGDVLITEEKTSVGRGEFITETRKIPVFEEGKVVRVVTVIHDITERKRIEAAIRESEVRYRAVVEDQTELICRFQPDWVMTFVNEAYCRYFGRPRDELVGHSFMPLLPEEDQEKVKEQVASLSRENPVVTYEDRALLPNGEIRWQQWTDRAIFDEQGRLVEYQSVGRDTTERKALEEQLRQAQKMETIGRLAGGVAHDFNNLLTAIKGYAGLAMDALHPADPVCRDIEQVLKAAERASGLTSQLLAFSRRQIIEPRVVNLNELVLEMDKMMRRLIGEEVELVVLPAPAPCLVRVDAGQIEQALVNLVVNARDAMPDGGRLTVETANVTLDEQDARQHAGVNAGPFVLLSIGDTGVGMSEEIQTHLFEPFFTTKDVGKGTGLGLATVYGIVKQHQGHIWVESEPGKGATFKIHLPRAVGQTERSPRRGGAARPPKGNETVLVVEDEPAVRTLMVHSLRKVGYNVLEATGADEAIRIAREPGREVHLLLTDVVMPGLDGRMLAGLLQDVYSHLRVLYVSGYAANVLARHGVLQEGIAFLQKPFDAPMLARKVREVLDAPEEKEDQAEGKE